MVDTHSKNYNTVKKYYDNGCWNLYRVKRAVVKCWITRDEYKEITGFDYEEE